MIIVLLFSYVPAIPAEHCPDGDHEGNHHEGNQRDSGKLECGYIFHCPFVANMKSSEPLIILKMEWLSSTPTTVVFGDFRFPIFHPPEGKVKEAILI